MLCGPKTFRLSLSLTLIVVALLAGVSEVSSAQREWSLDSSPEDNREPIQNYYEKEKKKIQDRLRKRYHREKRIRDRRERAQRLRELQQRKRIAQEKYLKEKGFRRKSLTGKLQEERVREMGASFLPQSADGSARMEARQFLGEGRTAKTIDNNFSVLGELEMSTRRNNFELKIWNLARLDATDSHRTRLLPYENWVAYKTNTFQAKVGMQIENWSMTEIFHPSDVFNSRNLDSELENAEKMGEPAASVRWELLGGFASFYYMPTFLAPVLPSEKSRLSAAPESSNMLDPEYFENGKLKESSEPINQYALRYTRKLGPGDISLHYLSHVDRQQPLFVADISNNGLRPVFLKVDQLGGNGSFIIGENLYKFDIVKRSFPDTGSLPLIGKISHPDHTIVALGSERSLFHQNGWESTFFLEFQKLFGLSRSEAESTSIFQHDLMLGYRLAVNDLKGKELKAFLIKDLDHSDEMLWAVSYYQKIATKLKISGGWRGLMSDSSSTKNLNDTDHAFVNLTYFF